MAYDVLRCIIKEDLIEDRNYNSIIKKDTNSR